MDKTRPKQHHQLSVSDAQPEQHVGVTVLTEKSFLGVAQICEPRPFNETNLGELIPHVYAYRKRWPDDLVVIIAEVTGKQHGDLDEKLIELTQRRFPTHIIGSLVNEHTRQPYLPGEGGRVPGSVAWVLKYRGGSRVFHDNPVFDSPEAVRLLSETTWIAGWVGARAVVDVEKPPGKPVRPPMAVIVFSRHQHLTSSDRNNYGNLMVKQYQRLEAKYRFRMVRKQPLYLFMDLDRLFNNFKVNVATTDWEINTYMVSADSTQGSGQLIADRLLNSAGTQTTK